MAIVDANVGANRQHLIDSAVGSHGLRAAAADTPQSLLADYKARLMLPPSATVSDAMALKAELRERERRACKSTPSPELDRDFPDLASLQMVCSFKKPDQLLKMLGIETQILPNGKKELSSYQWTPKKYSFAAAKIDETKLIEGVESIKGDCDLQGSSLKNLGGIKSIGKLLIPYYSQIEDLSSLKYVGEVHITGSDDLSNAEKKEFLRKLKMNEDAISRAWIYTDIY